MKRCHCGAVLSAYGAVQSGIVGYNTISLEAGKWYLVAPQFDQVSDSTATTVDLLSILKFSGLTPVAYSASTAASAASQIQIYDGAGYDTYFYINNGRKSGDPNTGSLTGWGKNRNLATDIQIELGKGFWLKIVSCETGATLTVSGSVYDAEQRQFMVGGTEGTWAILCNPFPVALTWDNVVTEGLEPVAYSASTAASVASQIQVYDGSGYDTYFYINNGRRSGDPNTGSLVGWGKNRNLASGAFAGVGQAFWVKAMSSGTLTFSK